ncbi:aminopeptidase [Nonlabens spongiae]|uniref:Aminopeptidase n=1 Tax=Nonlabens spongiae TaxID=331648 RepID=A0A1W6MH12_9FLAO|nr:M24 family metallopeptidase [Nonlabens spongiae]ARN76904.1 aminopeptidase [Nonlabens spongiae]
MNSTLKHLQEAESKAAYLFDEIQKRGLIQPGFSEKEINLKILELAEELLGIKKYWHKRIVRAGKNTLCPYDENPPEVVVEDDDIVFLDFGPILEEWEADFGRTYVLGEDPNKQQLAADSERLWHIANEYLKSNPDLTGAELYQNCVKIAEDAGWTFGGPIAGHLIGKFPHEKLEKEDKTNYIHPENHIPLSNKDQNGNQRFWIIEIHLVDPKIKRGSFFEQIAGY